VRDIHISIVSHNQIYFIIKLLQDLENQKYTVRLRVMLTKNIYEYTNHNFEKYSYPIHIIENIKPKGFSENHNFAFKKAVTHKDIKYFVVANPDIRLDENVVKILVDGLKNDNNLALVAPVVYGTNGIVEDSIRELPSPYSIFTKFLGKKDRWNTLKCNQPDWVAGMFMVFRANAYQAVSGFNENYFLYYEDVDICSRLWLKGYTIQIIKEASVIHDAQRTSRKNLKYLYWHLKSMFRFFNSETYKNAKIFHKQRSNNI